MKTVRNLCLTPTLSLTGEGGNPSPSRERAPEGPGEAELRTVP
jgi:hypothetical protein